MYIFENFERVAEIELPIPGNFPDFSDGGAPYIWKTKIHIDTGPKECQGPTLMAIIADGSGISFFVDVSETDSEKPIDSDDAPLSVLHPEQFCTWPYCKKQLSGELLVLKHMQTLEQFAKINTISSTYLFHHGYIEC